MNLSHWKSENTIFIAIPSHEQGPRYLSFRWYFCRRWIKCTINLSLKKCQTTWSYSGSSFISRLNPEWLRTWKRKRVNIISSVVLELASFLQKKYSVTYSVIRLNRNKSNWENNLNSMATIVRKWSFCRPQACIFIKKETLAQVISRKFCEISKNTFFHRIPLVVAFVAIHRFTIPILLYCLIWW